MLSGAHRRTSRASLVLLQLLVFVTYIFGPTAAFAVDPTPDPSPSASTAPSDPPAPSPEPTPAPTAEPTAAPTAAPDPTPAPSAPDPTLAPSDPTPTASPDPTPAPLAVTSPYLVSFAAGTSSLDQLAALGAAGAVSDASIPELRMHAALLTTEAVTLLGADARVSRLDLDRTRAVEAAPSDTSYADQWALPKIGWDQLYGTVGIAGTSTVAVLDTGVDATHPDLDGVVLPGTSVLDGSNGLSDPNGHGTWMAGIVAAETDNAFGIAGTAYAGVSVLPVTVLGADGTGQDSDIITGVVYAADAGADVILMSFSNPGYSAALQAAIDYAWARGAVLVAATGNDGVGTATFPAGDRGVIGVTSTDSSDTLALGANYGPAAFMAAPGVSITTTGAAGSVASISGTSAAAAQVAGAAALLAANEPFLSNGIIVSRLARNADPAGDPAQTGNGRLNLLRAMADASTESVQPSGAAPVGDGGPLVGPYVLAATVSGATISIREATCTTAQTSFVVNDTVCARATISTTGGGAGPDLRFQWYNSATVSAATLVSDTLYTGVTNGQVIDETEQVMTAGTWTVLICKTGNAGSCSSGNRIGTTTFTVVAAGTVSGIKFKDANANGANAADPADPGLAGWSIKAYAAGADGVLNATEAAAAPAATTTTAVDNPATTGVDETGTYSLTLSPGNYVICETLQASWFQSAPTGTQCALVTGAGSAGYAVTVTSGSSATAKDFGNFQNATINVLKYRDDNANGSNAADPADPGLPGWEIFIDRNGDEIRDADGVDNIAGNADDEVAITTNASGQGSFSVTPGAAYSVCETLQAGWFNSDPAGATLCESSGSLSSGGSVSLDFGNFQQGTVTGLKFEDDNADGLNAPDPADAPLAGWEIRAYVDANANGSLDAGETTVADTDLTAADGSYTLTLDPGTYVVCEVSQATWFQSAPDNTRCAAIVTLGEGGHNETVTSGSSSANNDFGNFQQGTVTGLKFENDNADGLNAPDPADAPLAGWEIRAYVDANANGSLDAGETTVADTDLTAADGSYTLTLDPGTYVVCEVSQATWFQSAPDNTRRAAIVTLGEGGHNETVTSGSSSANNDFGNFHLGVKSGHKYEDMDGDGNIAEDSANPLPGWAIRLYQDNGTKGQLDAADVLLATAITDDAGAYEFKDLVFGDYLVCELQKMGWMETFPGGTDECAFNSDLGPDGYAFSVTSGFSETTNDFGNFQVPWTVSLSPPDAVNDVGTNHTVTATVRNISGGLMAGVVVRFSTAGSTSASGSCTTNSLGQCTFTYTGPQLPGADIITAYADTDNDGTKDATEPQGQATKAWILPTTTPGQVTGGGQILNAAGNDKVAFGFNAKSTDNKLSGNCTVVDPHPSTDVKIKCLDVTSLVVTGTHATFFGNGTINGTPMTYRIDVDDLREPGRGYDTFKIQTSTGFILGGILTNGNIQIHK